MNINFSGKTVLVAGGTGGLGNAVSLAFLEEGARVVVTYRKEEEYAALKKAAGAKAAVLEGSLVDVTDEGATTEFVAGIVARHGRLDALVNTVGGYAGGADSLKFLVLPVAIGVVFGIGNSTRWYRTIFLEEINRDYVRTARAKGLSETRVLFRHVLRNGLIPILTGVVVAIPFLFMGSLLTESFFGIPGLGSYTIEAIQAQDFAVVRAIVFIGSVLYIVGLLLTDVSYTLADPRIRLQ